MSYREIQVNELLRLSFGEPLYIGEVILRMRSELCSLLTIE